MTDIEELKQRFNKDYLAAQENRDLANEDMRFIMVPGGMWEGYLEDHYADKPRLEYDLISQAVDRFMGEWSSNELAPQFADDESDIEDDAKLVDGIFRASYRKHGGRQALKNAVFEVAACGYGAVRLGTSHYDQYNPEDKRQEITFNPVFNAHSSVVWSAGAKQIDKRDADRVSLIHEYTKDQFEKQWPDHDVVSFAQKDDRRHLDWCTKNSVFVVEHYERISKKTTVRVFINPLGDKIHVEEDELEIALPELQGYQQIAKRKVTIDRIEKSLVYGGGYLEKPRRIAGKILPVIPFYGYWGFVDGQERYAGLVRKEKDPSRILNMQVSNLAELSAASPKESPIFDPEQVKGLESRWAQAHLGKKNFHLARPLVDKSGNVISAGPTGFIKPPQVDPATAALIQFTTDHIRSTSGGMPQDVSDPDASGKAILAVQKRIDLHTYTISDNIQSGVVRMGEAFISMGQEALKDNRFVPTLSIDGKESRAQLNRYESVEGRIQLVNRLSSKKFSVYAKAGPSHESQKRETVELLKELLVAIPEGDPRRDVVMASIIDNMQGVGLDTIKEYNRKQMLLTGIVEPESDEEKAMLQAAAERVDRRGRSHRSDGYPVGKQIAEVIGGGSEVVGQNTQVTLL